MEKIYISGHHDSVLRSHSWRSVGNSAAYLLPHLQKDDVTILDVGCGPGTITMDFATMYPRGRVVGIDSSAKVIQKANDEAQRRDVQNVTFEVADLLNLSGPQFQDASFDVVHAHQVLQHVAEPLRAFQAMRRLLKPGGLLATREAIISTFSWWPRDDAFDEFKAVWMEVAKSNHCDPELGSRLLSLALRSGFEREKIFCTASSWCYSSQVERQWWASLWAERMKESDFPKSALAKGFATPRDLERWTNAFTAWGEADDAWFGMMHGEIVCKI